MKFILLIFYLSFVKVFCYSVKCSQTNANNLCYYVEARECLIEHHFRPQTNYIFRDINELEQQEIFIDILNQARNDFAGNNSQNMNIVRWSENLVYRIKYNLLETNPEKCYRLIDHSNIVSLPEQRDLISRPKKIILIDYFNRMIQTELILFTPLLNLIGCEQIVINNYLIFTQCIVSTFESIEVKDFQGFQCSKCDISHSECNSIAYDNLCGYSGPQGSFGDKGEIGFKGFINLDVNNGKPGITGETGLNGNKGDRNYGLKGDTGQPGTEGDLHIDIPLSIKGKKGSIGPGGSNGEKGIRGYEGSTGRIGKTLTYPQDKIFYDQYEFWIIYLILWFGLAVNIIVLIRKSRIIQGTYSFPIKYELYKINMK